MKNLLFILILLLAFFFISCKNENKPSKEHKHTTDLYTCPMPEDSVFSDKPSKCSKCGMDLVKIKIGQIPESEAFTCPMHPQVSLDKAGPCPLCGMDLLNKKPIKKTSHSKKEETNDIKLEALIIPTNEFIVSNIAVTQPQKQPLEIDISALGNVSYDTREIGSISSRFSGRIERLHIKYRFQKIYAGQLVMEIYSPEILTAQENLVFLLKNDANNPRLIDAAKEKLSLLGISPIQLDEIMRTKKTQFTVKVYSNYSGHIHESGKSNEMNTFLEMSKNSGLLTNELTIKEGMYVQKGQSIFKIFNPSKTWAVLNIYGENHQLIQKGNVVKIIPEAFPQKSFTAKIDFIEPFYRTENKTLTVRAYFDNQSLKIPIGSQVKAQVLGIIKESLWLPKDAIISLGLNKVVFQKVEGGFKAHKIEIGVSNKNLIEIKKGLTQEDWIAANAQYLMDSESFVKVKN